MRRLIAVLAALTVALSGCASHQPPNEDEPGWNCRTQGNKQCGPVSHSFILVSHSDLWECDYESSDNPDTDDCN